MICVQKLASSGQIRTFTSSAAAVAIMAGREPGDIDPDFVLQFNSGLVSS